MATGAAVPGPDDPVLVIGLGTMGGVLAERLAGCGRHVLGHDIDPVARERAADAGVEVVPALDDAVVHRVLTTVVSLPHDDAVRSVLLAPDGLLSRLRPGSMVVETSTISPVTVRAAAEAAGPKGVGVVDAPVSGGPPEAETGSLVVFAAGEPAHIDAVEPVLSLLGTIHRLGAVGEGKTVKLVNNLMGLANLAVAAEAFTIGVRAGVDPKVLFDVLSVSGGRSHHFTKRFPWVVARDFTTRWGMDIGAKDLRAALDLARDTGTAVPLGSQVAGLYGTAAASGLAGEDVAAIVKLFERWADEEGVGSQ